VSELHAINCWVQGTLIAFAALSEQQQLGMLRSAGLLSPIAYLDKISSPLAVPSTSSIDSIGTVIHSMLVMCLQALSWLGMDEFDPTGYVISL
jgi:lysosomal acid lipase/cholesteryl ester hydrolase